MQTAATNSYLICTSPSAGGSTLASALTQTGIAGRPDRGIGTAGIAAMIAAATTANGVCGVELNWHEAGALRERLLAEQGMPQAERQALGPVDDRLHALMISRFGPLRYVWVRRRNLLAQAIAQCRTTTAVFDYDAIQRHLLAVEQFDRAWFGYFMRRKLPALIVIYEDFLTFPDKTIRGVLRYLGVPDQGLTIAPAPPPAATDGEPAEWEQRFTYLQTHGPEPRYTPVRPSPAEPRRKAPPRPEPDAPLIAYDLASEIQLPLEPAPLTRDWMDASPGRFAYRCLPLVIANQSGWLVRNTRRLTAIWDGSSGPEAVRVTFDDPPAQPHALSHFGSGILTFSLGYLFRTPPGVNLQVRGPINWPKDGICALDGIVETDWSHATFTMNWKLTRPGHTICFEVGEPICMISPVARGALEQFQPSIRPLASDPEWHPGYNAWSDLRSTFNSALKNRMPEAVAAGWQRHYTLGVNVGEAAPPAASTHQTSLSLAAFADHRKPAG